MSNGVSSGKISILLKIFLLLIIQHQGKIAVGMNKFVSPETS